MRWICLFTLLQFLRKETDQHISDNYQTHLLLLQESNDRELQQQKQNFQDSLALLQESIATLQTQINSKCK